MVRDVYAVPASRAGVEREFSQAGRVATWTRARLNPETITQSMMYKSYLSRIGKPMEEPTVDSFLDEDSSDESHLNQLSREFSRNYSTM